MSLSTEAAQGALQSYFDNQEKTGKNEIDLDNERQMLDFNTTNNKQKPLDRNSHLLAGLLSVYAAHPEIYGKNADYGNFLGDLGHAGVTREDMTYAKAPVLRPGGTGGGTSKTNALLGGLLKGAAGALGNKDAAKNDAAAKAANAASNYGGYGSQAQRDYFTDFMHRDSNTDAEREDFKDQANRAENNMDAHFEDYYNSRDEPQGTGEQFQSGPTNDDDGNYDYGGSERYDGTYGD
jgi:hypothetical protein